MMIRTIQDFLEPSVSSPGKKAADGMTSGGVRGSPRLSWLLASRMHVFNQLSKCVNVLIPNYNTQKIQSMIYRTNFDTIGIPRTWKRYDGSL